MPSRFHRFSGPLLLVIFAIPGVSTANDFNRGFDAYHDGDFESAFSARLMAIAEISEARRQARQWLMEFESGR